MTHRRRSFTYTSPLLLPSASCTPSGVQEEISIYSRSWCFENLPFAGALSPFPEPSSPEPALTTDGPNPDRLGKNHTSPTTCRLVVRVVKSKSDRRDKIKRLQHKNMKLRDKISKLLQIIQDTGYTVSSESNQSKPVSPPKTPRKSYSTEEQIQPEIIPVQPAPVIPLLVNPSPNKYSVPEFEQLAISGAVSTTHSYCRDNSEGPDIERVQQAVIYHARCWSLYSGSIEEFIDRLEEYKSLVATHIKKTSIFENTIKSLRDSINKCKAQQKKLGLESETVSKRISKRERKDEEEETGRKVWRKIDSFLIGLTPDVLSRFTTVSTVPLVSESFPSLLNMHAVNRLAAILKMVKYCYDTSTDLDSFQFSIKEGHYSPLLSSHHYYPSSTELSYLLTLQKELLEEEIFRLRSLLLEVDSVQPFSAADPQSELEQKLAKIVEQNRVLQNHIKNRAISRKKTAAIDEKSKVVLKKYHEMIPALKRKRQLKEEQEDWAGCEEATNNKEFEKPECYGFYHDTRTTPSSVTATPPAPELASRQWLEGMKVVYPGEVQ